MSTKHLRLRCTTSEDVDVVSSLMQDALVRVRDLQFLKDEQRFVGVFNRFRWELKEQSNDQSDAAYEDVSEDEKHDVLGGERQRVHAGLCLEHATNVRTKNFPKDDPEGFLNLLSIISGKDSTTLLFADKVSVQIQHKKLALFLEDLGEAWPTGWKPNHDA